MVGKRELLELRRNQVQDRSSYSKTSTQGYIVLDTQETMLACKKPLFSPIILPHQDRAEQHSRTPSFTDLLNIQMNLLSVSSLVPRVKTWLYFSSTAC